jgi:hypothetical protein
LGGGAKAAHVPNLPRWHKHQFAAHTFELRFSQEFFAKRMDRTELGLARVPQY